MPIRISEMSEYQKLSKMYVKAYKEFQEREKALRSEIFGGLEKDKRIIEIPLEKEFLELWEKSFSKEYSLDKFRFDIDLYENGHRNMIVMGMKTPKGSFDLEKIALTHPKEERKPEILHQINKSYLLAEKEIKRGLELLGFDDIYLPKKINDFMSFYGILIPKVEYFNFPEKK